MKLFGIPPYSVNNINRITISEKAFSAEECNKFLNFSQNSRPQDLKILFDFILEINNSTYHFDVTDLRDTGLLTLTGNKGVPWNIGLGNDDYTSTRKLAFFLFLSSRSNYTGGSLLFDPPGKPFLQDKGTLVIFPSYNLFMIEPVTKGESIILSGWLNGNHFQ